MDYLKTAISGGPNTYDAAQYGTVGVFLGIALNIMLGTGIAISIIAIILSGIKFLTSKGDPKSTADAKTSLTYSVVAFLLVVGAFTIKAIIINMLGAEAGPDITDAVPTF
jgi:uncharacterized membrane protein